MTTGPATTVAKLARHLLWYRVLAFATGVMLLVACGFLVLTRGLGKDGLKTASGLVWMGHGWLYLVYFIVAAALGIKLRWSWGRIVLVLVAGMVPTASFFAEHSVTRDVRHQIELCAAGATEPAGGGVAQPSASPGTS